MKNIISSKIFFILVTTVIIMIILPWLVINFVNGDAGMAVCFLLFYAIYPLYSTIIGMIAGRNIKKLWPMPIFVALLFLIGTWCFFEFREIAFLIYAGIYLLIGIIVMLLSVVVQKKN